MLFTCFTILTFILAYLYGWTTSLLLLYVAAPLTYFSGYVVIFLVSRGSGGSRTKVPFTACIPATLYHLKAKRRWVKAASSAKMNQGSRIPRLINMYPFNWPKGYRRPPRIMNRTGSSIRYTLDITTQNQSADEIRRDRAKIMERLRCKRLEITRASPGYIYLTIEWDYTNTRLQRLLQIRSQLRNLPLSQAGMEEADTTFTHQGKLLVMNVSSDSNIDVPVYLDRSVLIVGESGTGKSNMGWHIIREIQRLGVPLRVWAVDPKKVELAQLDPHTNPNTTITHSYASEKEDVRTLISHAKSMMNATLDEMRTKSQRSVSISDTHPLNIIWIDELLLLDDAMRKNPIDTPLGTLLIEGRAAGFIVIANAQLGQVDAIGRVRDLFPQRMCMKVSSPEMAYAALGSQAMEKGAYPQDITQPGASYILNKHTGLFDLIHPPYINDDEVYQITTMQTLTSASTPTPAPKASTVRASTADKGIPRPSTPNPKPGVYYVYLFYPFADPRMTDSNRPLYVGITNDTERRFKEHQSSKGWWSMVDPTRTKIIQKRSEQEARYHERDLIRDLDPVFNISQRDDLQ